MLKEGDVYSLIVNDVYGEDADEYVCRAVNKGGIKSTRAELIIMSKCLCFLFSATHLGKAYLEFNEAGAPIS
jgi:hypothetical protein